MAESQPPTWADAIRWNAPEYGFRWELRWEVLPPPSPHPTVIQTHLKHPTTT